MMAINKITFAMSFRFSTGGWLCNQAECWSIITDYELSVCNGNCSPVTLSCWVQISLDNNPPLCILAFNLLVANASARKEVGPPSGLMCNNYMHHSPMACSATGFLLVFKICPMSRTILCCWIMWSLTRVRNPGVRSTHTMYGHTNFSQILHFLWHLRRAEVGYLWDRAIFCWL